MFRATYLMLPVFCLFSLLMLSCHGAGNAEDTLAEESSDRHPPTGDFVQTMQKHLDAVTNRDLVALKSTMAPTGEMQLILPGTEIINTVDGFMDYHKVWFSDSTWTFETKILNTRVGRDMGMAITEIIYREPDRDGQPYWNRMIVSYDLQNISGKWYIVKDHASSIAKSTDGQ